MILINHLSPKMKDLTGVKIGSLTATRPLYKRNKNAAVTWEWRCTCGNTCNSEIATLQGNSRISTNPKIPSCGCVKIESAIQTHTTHGLTKKGNTHPLFTAYVHMVDRCNNPKHRNYKDYGQKGVTVCDEWLSDKESFFEWSLKNGWKRGLSIDKDILCKEKGIYPHIYSPDTCLWVTQKENVIASGTRDNYGKSKKIKLSIADCKAIKTAFNQGVTAKELKQTYNVSLCSIYAALKTNYGEL